MATFVRRHVVAVAVAFLALGGTAFALNGATASKAKTYYACVTQRYGTLNLTSKSAACPRGQPKITFNAQGARGTAGAPGAAGATGPQGPQGERGPSVL